MNNQLSDMSLTLESVQQRFQACRISRTKRDPIPEPQWEAASCLCRNHPITQVFWRFRLSFADLKKRLSSSNSALVHFMELDLSCFTDSWHMDANGLMGPNFGSQATSNRQARQLNIYWHAFYHNPDHQAHAHSGGRGSGGFSKRAPTGYLPYAGKSFKSTPFCGTLFYFCQPSSLACPQNGMLHSVHRRYLDIQVHAFYRYL